jgi:hypothetical protein
MALSAALVRHVGEELALVLARDLELPACADLAEAAHSGWPAPIVWRRPQQFGSPPARTLRRCCGSRQRAEEAILAQKRHCQQER